jgi:hypothetical protein
MAAESLNVQFRQIVKNIDRITKERMLEMMMNSAGVILHRAYELKTFHDVTGNLINSLAVGIYYKGQLQRVVGAANTGIDAPTMKSLKYKQVYPLETYWDGTSVGKNRFKADFIGANNAQSGRSLAIWTLQRYHPAKSATYSLVVIAPMSYARWVETHIGHDVLTKLRDEAPNIVLEFATYDNTPF